MRKWSAVIFGLGMAGCTISSPPVSPVQPGLQNTLNCLIPPWNAAINTPLYPVTREQLAPCESSQHPLGYDEQLWETPEAKQDLLNALDRSLAYLNSANAARAYNNYPLKEINRAQVRRSLQRFRTLLQQANSPEQLQAAVQREFTFYQAIGQNQLGTVLYSGYFEPIYPASPVKTDDYQYPIYKRPPNLNSWPRPHPVRKELEGEDGTGGKRLQGLELYWLRTRWEAYLIHIQGSARLTLPNGEEVTVGYAGNTRHNYNSIGGELVKDGKIPLEELTLPRILTYFEANPGTANEYINRDNSFVFFQENNGTPATGSIGVPLSAERSIATDKQLMPPGALALIHTAIPEFNESDSPQDLLISRYVLDQDAGGAIKGPGRVDYFLGSGENAGNRAGVLRSYGQLYYLVLKE
ncbi:MltA domain-containing protein [Spirulina sp. CS-785/01]|uniref:murein transglycosylase A n=1 Tax=Spirulina sp. CS-785/01 TaxID=3021716 RepID=UPI002330E258|nr:MltA domain-containing protein [Spirulina sp. CS-785/01]MDB9314512.1 MltA domain-containing protein [Spirulina sp. CS-785/01]